MTQIMQMNCPIHHNKILYSRNQVSFSLKNNSKKKNKKDKKINIISLLFYCSKCDEFYFSCTRFDSGEALFINDAYGGVYLTNCFNKKTKAKNATSGIIMDSINLEVLKQEICKILKCNSLVIGTAKTKCIYDNTYLEGLGKVIIDINNIQRQSQKNCASSECYKCSNCNTIYFVNDIITPLKRHLKNMNDLKRVRMISYNGYEMTKDFPNVSDILATKDNQLISILFSDKDDYPSDNIRICKKIPKKCNDGTKLISDSKLLSVSLKNRQYIINGSYCPKCCSIFFDSEKLYNGLVAMENKSTSEIKNNVSISIYNSLAKKRVEIKPDKLFKRKIKYKKYLKINGFSDGIIISGVLSDINAAEINKVLNKYNYSLSSIEDSIACCGFINEMESIFKKNIDCFIYNDEHLYNDLKLYLSSSKKVEELFIDKSIDELSDSEYLNIYFSHNNSRKKFIIQFSFSLSELKSINDNGEILKSISKIILKFELNNNTSIYELNNDSEALEFIIEYYIDSLYSVINRLKENHIFDSYEYLKSNLKDNNSKFELIYYKKSKKKIIEISNKNSNNRFIYEVNSKKSNDALVTVKNSYNNVEYCFLDKNKTLYDEYIKSIINEELIIIENESNNIIHNSVLDDEKSINNEVLNGEAERVLSAADFLVRSSNYSCINNNHEILRINAIVCVINKNIRYEISVPAAYCKKCNRYYILENYYDKLKNYGYICCKIEKFDVLIGKKNQAYSSCKDKSLLKIYGYNVNSASRLTEGERHRILDFVIGNKIMSRNEVITLLEWQVQTKKKDKKYRNAVEKWGRDLEYLRKRQKISDNVIVNSLKIPIKKIKL